MIDEKTLKIIEEYCGKAGVRVPTSYTLDSLIPLWEYIGYFPHFSYLKASGYSSEFRIELYSCEGEIIVGKTITPSIIESAYISTSKVIRYLSP